MNRISKKLKVSKYAVLPLLVSFLFSFINYTNISDINQKYVK